MANVLVVDDSPVDRALAGGLLKKAGMSPAFAANGREALGAIEASAPEIVVTDMQMPEMDGLELVEAIRRGFPQVPVVLMTAHGSEELAVQALQRGAASYVAKRNLARELAGIVASVLDVARADRTQDRLQKLLVQTEWRFEIENDIDAITPIVVQLEGNLRRMRLCDETGLIQVAVALREALVNAINHGNLELSSELLEQDESEFLRLYAERRRTAPWSKRRVSVVSRETRTEATYVIADEGRGFDPTRLPDPTDPANLDKRSGRGLLLIRTFMDEVRHSEGGACITMIKRRDPGAPSSRRS